MGLKQCKAKVTKSQKVFNMDQIVKKTTVCRLFTVDLKVNKTMVLPYIILKMEQN